MWLLNDPWRMSDRQILVPQVLAQMLILCDGTRTPEKIHADLCAQIGESIPLTAVISAIDELDNNFLLFNERFEAERQRLLDAYRSQPFRPPALADLSYPSSPQELSGLFDRYGRAHKSSEVSGWHGRGVISPHIDYQRGGPVYAQVWQRAAPSVLEADLVLIFGTDHNGSPGRITLTRQAYATPFGILPADLGLIDHLADALGPESAFAEELNHRTEHSVELSAVWLHHIFVQAGITPCPMVPILVGSFHHFLNNGHHPADDPTFNRFLTALRRETSGRRVLTVGSVDLAHVGPAFGDSFAMDSSRRERLTAEDKRLMDAVTRGDAAEFYRQIWAKQDRNRICGFAPLYLMLRHLDATGGMQVAYEHCAADQTDTSLVSICGILID